MNDGSNAVSQVKVFVSWEFGVWDWQLEGDDVQDIPTHEGDQNVLKHFNRVF
jgi:hypothetical protein